MMMEAARSFVSRKQAGGTNDYCAVVACACTAPEQPRSLAFHADSSDALETRASPEDEVLTTSPQKPARKCRMHILLVFEGDGRLKNSLKRSLQPLVARALPTGVWSASERDALEVALLSGLCSRSSEWALGLIRQPTCRLASVWHHGQTDSLDAYLTRRVSSSLPRQGPAAAATMAQLGIDVLGPKKQHAPPVQLDAKRMRLAHTEASVQPDSAESDGQAASKASPEAHEPKAPTASPAAREPSTESIGRLTEILCWSGELTDAIAAERARELLRVVHAQSEELMLARLQLKFYKERDEVESAVSPNPYPGP